MKLIVQFHPLPTAFVLNNEWWRLRTWSAAKHSLLNEGPKDQDLEILKTYCWWLRNPAVTSWYGKYHIPSFTGFHTFQVVEDFFHQQYHYSLFDRHSGTWIHPAAKIAASSDPPGPCPHGEKSKVHEQSPVEKHRKARDNGIHIPHKEYGMTCWNWWISRRDMGWLKSGRWNKEDNRRPGFHYDWRKTSTDSQKLVEAVRPKAMKYPYNHRIYKPIQLPLCLETPGITIRQTWDPNAFSNLFSEELPLLNWFSTESLPWFYDIYGGKF